MRFILFLILAVVIIGSISSVDAEEQVPDWVKNTAGWWATDAISETEFVNAMEFLIKNGIINVNEKSNFKDTCNDELLLQFDEKAIRKLCTPFYNLEYEEYQIFPKDGRNVIDNHGFRCNVTDFEYKKNNELCKYPKEKPSNVYRIFLIGGSTVFSSNNDNAHTASAFLQEKISSEIQNNNIQVINAGISGASSQEEVKLVKEKIVEFEPDLIIGYDGWNDLTKGVSSENWSENWKEICEIGNEKKFETIVFLQPLLGTGYKTFFDYEYDLIRKNTNLPEYEKYEKYHIELEKLNQSCYGAYDLTHMFDKIPTQIFWDNGHVGSKGDKILADNIFEFILPLLDKTQSKIEQKSNIPITNMDEIIFQLNKLEYSLDDLNFENASLSNLQLENQSIKNATFYRSILKNISFENTDLNNAIFTGTDLDNVDFSNANLSGTVFFKTNLNNVDFSNANLDNVIFVETDFGNSIFNLSSLQKTKLINSVISLTVTKFDSDSQKSTYKPIENREKFVGFGNSYGNFVTEIDLLGNKHALNGLFLPTSFLIQTYIDTGEVVYIPYNWEPATYKTLACFMNMKGIYSEYEDYTDCVDADKSLFPSIPGGDINDIPVELENIFQDLMNEDKKTVVIFPTITLHAYYDNCVWNYYEALSDNCQIIEINNDIDFNNVDVDLWRMHFLDNLSRHFLYNTNFNSFQVLSYLNYEMLSDLEIEKTPYILQKYDKIIVLHNKYVTKNIFNAITSHEKVIYLYPGSLSEEVKINFDKNLITVLSPVKYPEDKNYRNDFSWEYDNTHKEFQLCHEISEPIFEIVSNGIMTNCFPENAIQLSPELLKIIKDY